MPEPLSLEDVEKEIDERNQGFRCKKYERYGFSYESSKNKTVR